jgi:hypothetical protein
MPILPPLKSIMATMSAAADRFVTEPLIAIASASYISPKPFEPENYCGVVTDTAEGIILNITEPSTLTSLAQLRDKVISSSDGLCDVMIVEKLVAATLVPNMPTTAILDRLESQLDRAYSILLEDRYRRVRF